MEIWPFQKPHPPFWYGVIKPDSAERSAKAGYNIVGNDPAKAFRASRDATSAAYQASPAGEYPKFGMIRYMMLAETEAEALEIGAAPTGAGGRAS